MHMHKHAYHILYAPDPSLVPPLGGTTVFLPQGFWGRFRNIPQMAKATEKEDRSAESGEGRLRGERSPIAPGFWNLSPGFPG